MRDRQQAVDYLSGEAPYADRSIPPQPALMLLDFKMPRLDALEVLAWLATQPDLKALPIVVLSSASSDADVHKMREMGARDFFVKPHRLAD